MSLSRRTLDMKRPGSAAGFSLLEVMIALLIFSIGLLGLAGLLVVSVKTNQSAYLRSQASFMAQTMADRMRANAMGVWNGAYNKTIPSGSANPTCPCDVATLAQRDLYWWDQELANFLPNASGSIACARNGGVVVPASDIRRPPYDGTCTIRLAWSEASLNRDAAATTGTAADSQTFVWVFQP
jgi:type IV pilus assembly protein PilV